MQVGRAVADHPQEQDLRADCGQAFANLDGSGRGETEFHFQIGRAIGGMIAGIGMGEHDIAIVIGNAVLRDERFDHAFVVLVRGKTDFGIGGMKRQGLGILAGFIWRHFAAEAFLAV